MDAKNGKQKLQDEPTISLSNQQKFSKINKPDPSKFGIRK